MFADYNQSKYSTDFNFHVTNLSYRLDCLHVLELGIFCYINLSSNLQILDVLIGIVEHCLQRWLWARKKSSSSSVIIPSGYLLWKYKVKKDTGAFKALNSHFQIAFKKHCAPCALQT